MKFQSNLKKPSFIATAIVSAFVGLGLVALANSPKGKELYADVWLEVFYPFLLFVLYIFVLITTWKKVSKKRQIGLAIIALLTAWLAFASLSLHWDDLPWGRKNAIDTANSFMTDLKNADYPAAFEKLSPVTQNYMTPADLDQPDAQPITWHLENINRDSEIFGTATFNDGVQLPVKIHMVWLNRKWKIVGTQFGEWKKDAQGNFQITTRLDFLFCCDSHGIIFDKIMSLIDENVSSGFKQSP